MKTILSLLHLLDPFVLLSTFQFESSERLWFSPELSTQRTFHLQQLLFLKSASRSTGCNGR